VFIETQPDTAPGRYEATIGLNQGAFKTLLRFEVITG
jgi:hypothetical protein